METQDEIGSFDRRMNEDHLYDSDYAESTNTNNYSASQNMRGAQIA